MPALDSKSSPRNKDPDSLNRPRGDQLVNLAHEADCLFEGHHGLAVVGYVVVGEGAPFAVLDTLLQDLIVADVELLRLRLHVLKLLSLVDAHAPSPALSGPGAAHPFGTSILKCPQDKLVASLATRYNGEDCRSAAQPLRGAIGGLRR